ncbi:MAG TPA: MarR family transcriptional regulator [Lachnospiraceae bacterium]|jgi:DNA-binding MarR family transcriptional regulator|nr:MarR family transcriptional regulator [Lachnospiraceae bacterium]HBY71433.1 MarR family transcriptional regulator [Lachnospiraceae bacterium]HCA69599.1 MarR family transcriptional regulator [Lachnospiraceae bacterium]HCM12139.1 MarR family transcriptional regulator [Lachnospiraceae bacterium]HCR40672.1 MarR family transcriptional regulator [Lachnospiraceae bacterium]
MFNLDDCIACITSRSAKKLADCFEKRLNVYNITRTQWIALYYISRNKTITQRQLAGKMSLKEPTVVRLIDKMEVLGWVVRTTREDDKRIKLLELTEKGQKVETEMREVAEKFRNDVISGISAEELNSYKSTLDKMLCNIKNG